MERYIFGQGREESQINIPEGYAFVNINFCPYDRNGIINASRGERYLNTTCLIMPSGLGVFLAPLHIDMNLGKIYFVSKYLPPKNMSKFAVKWCNNWSQTQSELTVIQSITDYFNRFPRYLDFQGNIIKHSKTLQTIQEFSIPLSLNGFPISHQQILNNQEKRFPAFTV